jgi:hypothetical protein
MNKACSMHGRGFYKRFWQDDLKERDYEEDPDLNGRIILKLIEEK